MRLQPPFFVHQTEIILQTALLFSYFFLSFFGEGFQVAQRFVSCLSRFHITRGTGDEYDSVVLCQHGCSELRQPNFYRFNQGVCPETEQVSPKIVALKIMKTREFLLIVICIFVFVQISKEWVDLFRHANKFHKVTVGFELFPPFCYRNGKSFLKQCGYKVKQDFVLIFLEASLKFVAPINGSFCGKINIRWWWDIVLQLYINYTERKSTMNCIILCYFNYLTKQNIGP